MKKILFLNLLAALLVFCLTGCDDNAEDENKEIIALNGTWVNNRDGILKFTDENWEYWESVPIYKGNFSINRGWLITRRITHFYGAAANSFGYEDLLVQHGLKADEWYSTEEIKNLIGDDLFNEIANESNMDPVAFTLDPIPYKVERNMLYFGNDFYSKQHIIDKFYMRYTNYGTGSLYYSIDLKISDLYSLELKRNFTYRVNISGSIDSNVERIYVNFHGAHSTWIGGSHLSPYNDIYDLSPGPFNITFDVTIFDDAVITRSSVYMYLWSNVTEPPEDYKEGTIMATINNFTISIVEI